MSNKLNIFFTPGFNENQYTENLFRLIESLNDVSVVKDDTINMKTLKSGFKYFDYAVVGWLENSIVNNQKEITLKTFVRFIVRFLILTFISKRVLYFRHNLYPHGVKQNVPLILKIINLICRMSYKTVVHSGHFKSESYSYLPHPLYKFNFSTLTSKANNIKPYIVFGRIVEYKSIDRLLLAWPNTPLSIYGSVGSTDYLSKINSIVSDRHLNNVAVNDGYIRDDEIANHLLNSKGLLLTHCDHEVIVSGSFFFATSLGVPVYALRTPFLDWVLKEYEYPGLFLYDSLSEMVESLSRLDADFPENNQILAAAKLHFGDAEIKRLLGAFLNRPQ